MDEMRCGYSRVSSDDQNLGRQRTAQHAADCAQITEEAQELPKSTQSRAPLPLATSE